MLRYLFISAWRNILKNKLHTFINISGLTLGLSCAIVAYLILQYEYSFDKHQTKYEHIFRIVSEINFSGSAYPNPGIPVPLANHLETTYPEIAHSAKITSVPIRFAREDAGKDGKIRMEHPVFTTTSIFSILDVTWLAGSPETALEKENGIVLAQKEVEKLFPQEEPMGKVLVLNDTTFLEVTGVIANPTSSSSFAFTAIAAYEIIKKEREKNAGWLNTTDSDQFLMVLHDVGQEKKLVEKINAFHAEQTKEKASKSTSWKFFLQPLSDIHYNTDYAGVTTPAADLKTLQAIVIIGIFLLVIGCINYINLATAIATNRSKEVGVRKSLGSSRGAIMRHYLIETATLITVSIFCSFALAELFLIKIDSFINLNIESSLLQLALLGDWSFYAFLVALITIMTLIAGGYPALVISSYNPVQALKNKVGSHQKSGLLILRRALVVFQFGISQVLVLGALVVFTQLHFSKTKDWGFEKDTVLNFSFPFDFDTDRFAEYEAFKNILSDFDGVNAAALSNKPPISYARSVQLERFPTPEGHKEIMSDVKMAEPDWFNVYTFKFLAGKPYHAQDSMHQVVINQTLMQNMGFKNPEEVIGLRLGDDDDKTRPEIVGVVSDFHTGSLHQTIAPVTIYPNKSIQSTLEVAVDRSKVEKIVDAAKTHWPTYFPEANFNWKYVEENAEAFYQNEEQMLRLFNLFAVIAGFICCLGLYGLVSFMAVQRTKEIGIRKVLGANIGNILFLFFKEFLRLIIIALTLSLPIGYLLMNKWLEESFAYRIEIGFQIMIITIIGVLFITVLTISYQSLKAAFANPANALRTE